MEVGGDFYDVIDFGDDKVGIVIGDVSGKGIRAAVHTAEAKYMLRAYAMIDPDPAYVVSRLNFSLFSFTGDFTFITLFYGLVDTKAGVLTYANAGHETPIIVHGRERRVTPVKATGPVLGMTRGIFAIRNSGCPSTRTTSYSATPMGWSMCPETMTVSDTTD